MPKATTSTKYISPIIKRKGVNAKTKTSNHKQSSLYKKSYKGQGK